MLGFPSTQRMSGEDGLAAPEGLPENQVAGSLSRVTEGYPIQ